MYIIGHGPQSLKPPVDKPVTTHNNSTYVLSFGGREYVLGHITHFQELEDRAISNFGIVTTNDVVELGLHTTSVV